MLCIDGLYSFIMYFRNTTGMPHCESLNKAGHLLIT